MGIRLENAKNLYLKGIRDGDYVEAADAYISDERYTQHSTPVRDGKAGFIEFFADFVDRNPDREIRIIRGFEDGGSVFLQAEQVLNGGEFRYVTADMFDTDAEGKIVEHWDMIQEISSETVSGHSQIDGPTEPTDLDKTDENKAIVRAFMNNVLIDGNLDVVTDYISSDVYIQHNPLVGDGLDGFATYSAGLAEQGKEMVYEKVHKILGSGSFVAVLSKMRMGETDVAVIDLFRLDNGLIVEHWDVMEDILPADQWVNSGKF